MSDNAGLYAALGLAYLQYREAGIDFSEHPIREAERCVRKVFDLEPASASGLRLRGWIHYSRGQIQDADCQPRSAVVEFVSTGYRGAPHSGRCVPPSARA
jgi:hypothetical protein